MSFYRRFGKRAIDFTVATVGLALVSPVLLIVAILVRTRLGSPVLFRQNRPGLCENIFELVKFRTMTDEKGPGGELLHDTLRLLPFGEFLRRTSLDELPELWNVMRGDMSLVGPRPLLMRYLPYFTTEERLRFTVRPGITGRAQVSGRNDLSWDRRIGRDVEYAQAVSLKEDLRILWQTVRIVFRSEGYQSDPNAVMQDFDVERRARQGGQL